MCVRFLQYRQCECKFYQYYQWVSNSTSIASLNVKSPLYFLCLYDCKFPSVMPVWKSASRVLPVRVQNSLNIANMSVRFTQHCYCERQIPPVLPVWVLNSPCERTFERQSTLVLQTWVSYFFSVANTSVWFLQCCKHECQFSPVLQTWVSDFSSTANTSVSFLPQTWVSVFPGTSVQFPSLGVAEVNVRFPQYCQCD